MVRLIDLNHEVKTTARFGFQFQNGSINSLSNEFIMCSPIEFQFQNGSINRASPATTEADLAISIPKWFD